MTPRYATRAALIAKLTERLVAESFPRLTILLILILSGGCAFLFSAASLSAGLDSMGLRYFLGALIGYITFVVLIQAWIAYRRGNTDSGPDLPELDSATDVRADSEMFEGGRSADGGAGASWKSISGDVQAERAPWVEAGETAGGAFDLDEWLWMAAVVLLVAGGLVAILYVVYIAPVLLAEVALDAALVSAMYRRLRRRDVGHWIGGVLRRTWLPALVLTLFITILGFALQRAVPEARSIGDVLRAMGG